MKQTKKLRTKLVKRRKKNRVIKKKKKIARITKTRKQENKCTVNLRVKCIKQHKILGKYTTASL
jgi:hypothetical protein